MKIVNESLFGFFSKKQNENVPKFLDIIKKYHETAYDITVNKNKIEWKAKIESDKRSWYEWELDLSSIFGNVSGELYVDEITTGGWVVNSWSYQDEVISPEKLKIAIDEFYSDSDMWIQENGLEIPEGDY